jgi:hypothetical protein
MADPRQDNSTQRVEETIRHSRDRTAEQTKHIAQAATEAGNEFAKASATLWQQNAEMLQRFGFDMVTTVMGRSMEQLGHSVGSSGNQPQEAAERSARNAESILYSATAIAKAMSGLSREYFDLVRRQAEGTMTRANELLRCRTPQDFAAVHMDLTREALERVIESSRRMGEMSLTLADDAATRMTQSMDQLKQAA